MAGNKHVPKPRSQKMSLLGLKYYHYWINTEIFLWLVGINTTKITCMKNNAICKTVWLKEKKHTFREMRILNSISNSRSYPYSPL